MERKQYPAIDIAKFICAIIILLYHCFSEHGPVFWVIEESLSLYAVAVALFMTLSGYLLFSKLDRETDESKKWQIVKLQIKRILTIYLLWSIPYLLYSIIIWDWSHITLQFVFYNIRKWVFQATFSTIWFMPSLAVGMILSYYLNKHFKWKYVCMISIALYMIGSLQSTYAFVFAGNKPWEAFVNFSAKWLQGERGGIFYAIPLLTLGGLASRVKWRNAPVLAVASVVSLGFLVAEAVLLKMFIGGCGLDLAVFMVPTCFLITMFLTSMSWSSGPVYLWMRSMSIVVFMSQRIFLTVIPHFLSPECNMQLNANPYLGALIKCTATFLFSALIIKLSSKHPFFKKLF